MEKQPIHVIVAPITRNEGRTMMVRIMKKNERTLLLEVKVNTLHLFTEKRTYI